MFKSRSAVGVVFFILLSSACTRAPQAPARYAFLPFDNLTGDASLDWIARTAPRMVAAGIAGTARPAASMGDAYLGNATRFVHGYFTKSANALRLTVEVEDANTHKMISTEHVDGSVLGSANALAKSLDPNAKPFPTSNEDAIASVGTGRLREGRRTGSFLRPRVAFVDRHPGAKRRRRGRDRDRGTRARSSGSFRNRSIRHASSCCVESARRFTCRTLSVAQADRARRRPAAATHEPRRARNHAPRNLHSPRPITKKILAEQPENAEITNKLGYAYGYQGRIADAEAAFTQYGKLPRREPNSLDSLGEVYFMNGKFAEAEKTFLHAHNAKARRCSPEAIFAKQPTPRLARRRSRAGADKIFTSYLDFRAKLKDPTIEWQHAQWEYATGRKDQAVARLLKSPSPQAAVQIRVWRGRYRSSLRISR